MMKNIRLYTFAVLFAHLPTPEKIVVYMKSRDKLATSDVKLSSRIGFSATKEHISVKMIICLNVYLVNKRGYNLY